MTRNTMTKKDTAAENRRTVSYLSYDMYRIVLFASHGSLAQMTREMQADLSLCTKLQARIWQRRMIKPAGAKKLQKV